MEVIENEGPGEVAAEVGGIVMGVEACAMDLGERPTEQKDPKKQSDDRIIVIDEIPLLTSDQEKALARRIEAGWFAGGLLSLRDPQTREASQLALNEALIKRADALAKSRQAAQRKKKVQDLEAVPFDPIETHGGRWETVQALTDLACWLKPEQVAAYELLADDAEKAFDHFVRANLRLAVNLATQKKLSTSVPLFDLIQAANLGIMRAVAGFDNTQGRFSTYAAPWIRHFLTREIAVHLPFGAVTASVQETIWKVRQVQGELMQTVDDPTPEQIAQTVSKAGRRYAPGFTAERVTELLRADAPVEPIFGDPRDPSGALSLESTLEEKRPEPPDLARGAVIRKALERALGELSEREQTTVRMLYGLHPYDRKYFADEVGKVLGNTEDSVKASMGRIRRKLAESPHLQVFITA